MSDAGLQAGPAPPQPQVTNSRSIDPENSPGSSPKDALSTDPPDGGKGWIVVFGSALALFSTTGIINAYGFFQSFYMDVLLSSSSSTTISLIGAVQICLVYAGGPVTGKIFDAHGLNVLLPLGSFLVVLALMLVSLCQQNRPYQFFLVQGVLSGVGNCMIFTPSVAVVGHWFKRRRGYALGIIISGSSLGGVVYPIMLRLLQKKLGFAWAVRIAGFVTLACLIVAILTVKTRLPTDRSKNAITLTQLFDVHGFRDSRYTLATMASFLYFYALFIPYFYIEESAEFNGVPISLSPYLLAIINGCGIPARIIPGILGDRFGVLQMLIPSTIVSGALVLALWLPARGDAPIILFSALYGLFSSSFVSMLPAYIATITPVENFGARLGTLYFFVAIACLVGTPTAGAFIQPSFTQKRLDNLIVFTGVLLLMSAVLIGLAHIVSLRKQRSHTAQNGDSVISRL
ncbi:monocarboxylate permease [Gautieria morchelliformis]|nr:monocarboxylate permease [Gautieria morchelliformis]